MRCGHLLTRRGLEALCGYTSTTGILHLSLHPDSPRPTHRRRTVLWVRAWAPYHRGTPVRDSLMVVANLLSSNTLHA